MTSQPPTRRLELNQSVIKPHASSRNHSHPRVHVTHKPRARRIRWGVPKDLSYVYSIMNRMHDRVGYAPKGGLLDRLETRRIIIVTENDAPAGYISFTHRRDGHTHMSQIAIDEEIWRTQAGTELMQTLISDALTHGSHGITLRTAIDLQANFFWPTLGFLPQRVDTPKRRRQIHWALPLDADPALPMITPVRGAPRTPNLWI